MEIDDLSPTTYCPELHEGVSARSVGWLGGTVRMPAHPDLHVLEQLRHYLRGNFHDDGDLGSHVCQICGDARGHGEFWIEWDGVRYVLPALIIHYCEAHGYQPPSEFLNALSLRWRTDNRCEWWLMDTLPDLNWARLTLLPSGNAEVFDCDGKTHQFHSEQEARFFLLEDEFRLWTLYEAADFADAPFRIEDVHPPSGSSNADLLPQMLVRYS